MRNDNDGAESDDEGKEVAEVHGDAEGEADNVDDCKGATSISDARGQGREVKGECDLDSTNLSGRYRAGQGNKCVKAPGTRGEVKLR